MPINTKPIALPLCESGTMLVAIVVANTMIKEQLAAETIRMTNSRE
ncbi:hypothetical protein AMI01nite_54350 [Aneurinibacillus migulanus]|nr:hypothetical protein AMI01nite_54350 [Aneurinibacillus migulanus]